MVKPVPSNPVYPIIACVQINTEGNLDKRLEKIARYCKEAANKGAGLVVLPENFAYFGEPDTAKIADREQFNGGIVRNRLAEIARQNKLWIVGGTLPLWKNDKTKSEVTTTPFATTLVYSSDGALCCSYNKINLFDVAIPERNFYYRESDSFTPGNGETVVFDSPIGRVGVVVCFDLRFPDLILDLARQGAQIIVAPSAFTRETGEDHWRLLLQARALDSLCYVAGANLAGRDRPKKATWGGSAIVSPWGKVITEMADGEGVIYAEIDSTAQARIRASMPILPKG